MARRTYRPGRTLVVFLVGVIGMFALIGLTPDTAWKPELGLDLQGGTRITLVAKDDPTAESLAEARNIIDQRVNGSGVAEAEVATQGSDIIVVEIPGESRRDLVETVKRQAQLRFRLVACSSVDGRCGSSVIDPNAPQPPVVEPPAPPSPAPPAPSGTANRPAVGFSVQSNDKKNDKNTESASPSESPSETPEESPTGTPTEDPSTPPEPAGDDLIDQPLLWIDQPDTDSVKAFNEFECPTDGSVPLVDDDPDKPLVTCDEEGVKYLLSASLIEGNDLDDANAVIPQSAVQWVVSLEFNGEGTEAFSEISQGLFGTEKQFAVVLDGQVLSAPTMNALILNGQAQIEGNFTQATATSLATGLKFGALPIAFADDPLIVTIGPSLAGDQLRAGLTAGLAGLVLVMIYCLIYYRGLGLVVLASLIVAGAVTYGMVLLLSQAANFTLTLPGIAGLIVAVGITADSFVVFFERIRDEMRDGKSMRVAVESGWARARNTCLAADAVSLLAAVALYIFAAGVVKGFAFALGLSTLIDLVVFFWFTHPMVSYLARYKFFNRGHRLSGLDRGALGIDRGVERLPVGSRA